ncbi:MAG: hypothetical protein MJ214_02965 [Bacilli bacterium]|nr:hypothetical protein [Bacilli bacterium]
MAVKFKSEEQRKLDKQAKKPKTKIEKARKTMFIFTIIFSAFSFTYFFVGFNPAIVILPILFLWIVVVILPTVISVGFIWTIEGYRNFAQKVTDWLGSSTQALGDTIRSLQIGLPYVGSIALATILSYGILSFLIVKKDKENKKNYAHLIVSMVLLTLVTLFFVLSFIFYNRVLQDL